jgi:transcriptional regulator with XRE-family HTH domain
MRIANDPSQRELADKVGVSEAQVSRDEHRGNTVDRAQRVLDAMNDTLTSRVGDKPLALA